MECLVKSDTDKSSERRSFKNAENEKKRNINHVEYHKKCNCIVRLMMQFDSSNFALYLFTVMLYKQSTGGRKKVIGAREFGLNGILRPFLTFFLRRF